jgi:hypothetical protein
MLRRFRNFFYGQIARIRNGLTKKNGSDWFRNITTKNYLIDNNATATTVTQKERLTFASGSQISSETISIDESGQSST